MSRPAQAPSPRGHVFYRGIAVALALSVFVGFSRTYYLKTLFGTPHLSWLAHLHGAVFTLWMLFFVFQTALVAAGRTALHRRIGWAGAGFGSGVAMLAAFMTLYTVRVGYASGRPKMADLLIHAVVDLFLFCGFFASGLILRRKKEAHKRLMVLAMISLIIPAFARFPIPAGMITWVICAFSLVCVVYDLAFLRRVHLTSILGAALISLTCPLRFVIADTRSWQNFAEWISR